MQLVLEIGWNMVQAHIHSHHLSYYVQSIFECRKKSN